MFYRKFELLFQDIIVIGAGGTGSRVIPPLIQTIKQSVNKINPALYIVDGDIVESKNLSRQNFIERDLGKNKAAVMADRYGSALNFPVYASDKFVGPDGDMYDVISQDAVSQGGRPLTAMRSLVIMCVDSIDARLKILKSCRPHDIIIDAGNEDTFGQVSIFDQISVPHLPSSNRTAEVAVKPFSGEYELPFIPSPVNKYLHALVNPSEATGSCADLDQSLAINFLMASGIINMVQNLAYDNKFYCRTNYFDLIKGNSTENMNINWFNQVFNERTTYKNENITKSSQKCALTTRGLSGANHPDVTGHIVNDINDRVTFIDPALLAALKI